MKARQYGTLLDVAANVAVAIFGCFLICPLETCARALSKKRRRSGGKN